MNRKDAIRSLQHYKGREWRILNKLREQFGQNLPRHYEMEHLGMIEAYNAAIRLINLITEF